MQSESTEASMGINDALAGYQALTGYLTPDQLSELTIAWLDSFGDPKLVVRGNDGPISDWGKAMKYAQSAHNAYPSPGGCLILNQDDSAWGAVGAAGGGGNDLLFACLAGELARDPGIPSELLPLVIEEAFINLGQTMPTIASTIWLTPHSPRRDGFTELAAVWGESSPAFGVPRLDGPGPVSPASTLPTGHVPGHGGGLHG